MSLAETYLKELQNLTLDIQSRIDEIAELESGLLSSPKWSVNKVQSNQQRRVDDVYNQLIVMKEAIEQDTNKIIQRKLELSRLINQLNNPKLRAVLRMTYINHMYVDDVCDSLGGMSRPTFYRLKKEAISELDHLLSDLIVNETK